MCLWYLYTIYLKNVFNQFNKYNKKIAYKWRNTRLVWIKGFQGDGGEEEIKTLVVSQTDQIFFNDSSPIIYTYIAAKPVRMLINVWHGEWARYHHHSPFMNSHACTWTPPPAAPWYLLGGGGVVPLVSGIKDQGTGWTHDFLFYGFGWVEKGIVGPK